MAAPSRYLLDNAAAETGQRFASLESLYDPVTIRHLETLGVQPGWRCWEVGAGSGSLARWLAGQVTPTGQVLATDINPRWMSTDQPASLECRQHDLTRDPLPGHDFDLIHARLVLSHLPHRAAALTQLVSALKPGGRLLIEDFDLTLIPLCTDVHRPAVTTVVEAFMTLLTDRGADLGYGSRLPALLRDAGLTDVRADGHIAIGTGDGAIAELYRANINQPATNWSTPACSPNSRSTSSTATSPIHT